MGGFYTSDLSISDFGTLGDPATIPQNIEGQLYLYLRVIGKNAKGRCLFS